MSNLKNGNALNREGRAFALASGFGSAMGSGMAVASASTSAYMDNLKIQAARPRSQIPVKTSSPNGFLQPNTFVYNPSLNAILTSSKLPTQSSIAPLSRAKSFANLSTTLDPLSVNLSVPDNVDPNPIVVKKKPLTSLNYTQKVSVKFLQPPPLQQPGDIVITQQKDVQAPSVAPRLVRQKPPFPVKPAPLVVRERPPLAPAPIAPEHHVIPGKVIPPPPRKVIIERLPQLPQPPKDIVVERWLEYGPRARRVVFRPAPRLIPAPAPKNVLIQWDSPNVALNRQYRNLGITPVNPSQYEATFGSSLVPASAIPALSLGIRPANGARLAAENPPHPIKLVGDIAALSLINRASNQHSSLDLLTNSIATTAGSALASFRGSAASFPNQFPPNWSSFLANNSSPNQSYSTDVAPNASGIAMSNPIISSRAPVGRSNTRLARQVVPTINNRAPVATNNYRSNSTAPTRSILTNRRNQVRPVGVGTSQTILQRSNSVLPTRSILANNNYGVYTPNQGHQAISLRSNSILPTRSIMPYKTNNRALNQHLLRSNISRQISRPVSFQDVAPRHLSQRSQSVIPSRNFATQYNKKKF